MLCFTLGRWQPADEAADPRYVGDIGAVAPKYGLFGKEKEKVQRVEDDLTTSVAEIEQI